MDDHIQRQHLRFATKPSRPSRRVSIGSCKMLSSLRNGYPDSPTSSPKIEWFSFNLAALRYFSHYYHSNTIKIIDLGNSLSYLKKSVTKRIRSVSILLCDEIRWSLFSQLHPSVGDVWFKNDNLENGKWLAIWDYHVDGQSILGIFGMPIDGWPLDSTTYIYVCTNNCPSPRFCITPRTPYVRRCIIVLLCDYVIIEAVVIITCFTQ